MTSLKTLLGSKLKTLLILSALFFAFGFGQEAMAGAGGTEFDDIYDLLVGWTQGTLGKIVALGMFMVGMSAGIVTQSIVSVVVGIAGALVMYYGPTVIGGVITGLI
jgi:conjugal transfer pilus assembly protein TraA